MNCRTVSSRRLRMGVIGCGSIGALHTRAINQSEHADLTAVCDVVPERATAVASNTSARVYREMDEMLAAEPLDAITVATSDDAHAAPVLAALAANCHVFCEKPLTMELAEAQRMVQAAVKQGVHLAVDFNRRFAFGYRRARELVSAGRIGRITHALIRVTDGIPPAVETCGPYALLFTLLTHHIDLLRWYCGEITTVAACFGEPDGAGLFRDVSLSVRCADSAVGSLIGGWREGQSRTTELMELGGTEGFLQVEDVLRRVRVWGEDPDRTEVHKPNPFEGSTAFYDTVALHLCSFAECLSRGLAPEVTGRDGVRSLEVVQAAIESHRRGRSIQV